MTPGPGPPPSQFQLTLVATTDSLLRQGVNRPAEYRLKGAIKVLLRGFGFRCTRITPVSIVASPATTPVVSAPQPEDQQHGLPQ